MSDSPIHGTTYADYGCTVNALPPAELFAEYRCSGFLYPEKEAALAPFLEIITENWNRAMRAGELILHTLTREGENGGIATITSWRTAYDSWVTQHLSSTAGLSATKDVMLAKCASEIARDFHGYHQSWFQPKKSMPRRVFGTVVASVGEEYSATHHWHTFRITSPPATQDDRSIVVSPLDSDRADCMRDLVTGRFGPVYVASEELDRTDLELAATDEIYRQVGLRRYRRIFAARDRATDRLLGVAIAWRGPLGFNFSFLENRCDLITAPDISSERRAAVASALLSATLPVYNDFEPGGMYLITGSIEAAVLEGPGIRPIREYACTTWGEPEGYARWYDHVRRTYDDLERRFAARREHRMKRNETDMTNSKGESR